MNELSVGTHVIDAGLPMHMVCDAAGTVLHAGPTLERIRPGLVGQNMETAFRIVLPCMPATMSNLLDHQGERMFLEVVADQDGAAEQTKLRGVCFAIGGGMVLLNFFFGTDVARAVIRHGLTARHFAPFDPTMELLFLMEARDVILKEFKQVSGRLDEARKSAEKQAVTDALTGLLNRRALDEQLQNLADRRSKTYALMHLDLDFFKSVNDTYGHAAGDCVLEKVGIILREQVRSDDLVARVGGDEFVLVFNNCDDVGLMQRIAQRIIARLEEPISFEGNTCRISGSIGITLSSYYADPSPTRMMAEADAALYASKKNGRSRATVAARPASEDV